MRTLSQAEIDQVSGGIDTINIGGISITGIEAGLALRNVMGATGRGVRGRIRRRNDPERGLHRSVGCSRWAPISISGRTERSGAVIDDEVPKPFASVIGHVCGVIAVGMTALSVFAIWTLAHKPTVPGLFFVSVCVGVSLLMYRWAGALTRFLGYARSARGVEVRLFGVRRALRRDRRHIGAAWRLCSRPQTVEEGLPVVIGVCSGSGRWLYLCYLAYRRFK